jgi:hypothetical protein
MLSVLMQPGRSVARRAVEALAEDLGTTFTPVHRTLRSLEQRWPQPARPDLDAGLDVTVWAATYNPAEASEH